jgi:hypothetical protein
MTEKPTNPTGPKTDMADTPMGERKHREAFCLMWYACKSCGHRECIWNSRDGVTPFGTTCPSCRETIYHVDWQRDEPAPNHKLIVGQRFWRDGTPDEAEAIMRRRIAKAKGGRWEASPEVAEQLIRSARDESDESEFRKGWPALDVYTGGAS